MTDFRKVYLQRLPNDRIVLERLAARLTKRNTDRAEPLWTEIQIVAHDIRGAAGVLGVPDVAEAAGTLECAAISAAEHHAEDSAQLIEEALRSLLVQIGKAILGDQG